jgi:Skp family chaperone for outer membrane proteins
MRKFLISAALLSVAAAATPASAQRYYDDYRHDYRGGQQIERQLDNIFQRIDRAYQRRLLSSKEARRLRDRAQDVGNRYARYRRDGLSPSEHHDLQRRIQDLRSRLQDERREGRYERRDDRRYDDRRYDGW